MPGDAHGPRGTFLRYAPRAQRDLCRGTEGLARIIVSYPELEAWRCKWVRKDMPFFNRIGVLEADVACSR